MPRSTSVSHYVQARALAMCFTEQIHCVSFSAEIKDGRKASSPWLFNCGADSVDEPGVSIIYATAYNPLVRRNMIHLDSLFTQTKFETSPFL